MTIVGVVLYKQFAGDGSVKAGAEMTAVPTPQLPKTDGADNDTPTENPAHGDHQQRRAALGKWPRSSRSTTT